jgi:tetratricopeptide (TPR) repeat protein
VRWVVLLMFLPAGIWAARKWGNRDALFVLLFFVCLDLAVNLAFFICDRYRYPVWPVMAVLAGGGLLALIQQRQVRALILASMAVMAAISLPNWFGAKLPSWALDYRLRAIAWYEKGHYQEALSDIDNCLALDPRDVGALQQRGNILLALNRLDDARKDFEQTLQLSDIDGGVWNNYAIALDGLGRINEALAAYQRAITCRPPSESAFLGLAFDQVELGRLDDASATLTRLDSVDPSPNAVAVGIRSVVARRRGDAAQADALEAKARAVDAEAAAWAIKRLTPAPAPAH